MLPLKTVCSNKKVGIGIGRSVNGPLDMQVLSKQWSMYHVILYRQVSVYDYICVHVTGMSTICI